LPIPANHKYEEKRQRMYQMKKLGLFLVFSTLYVIMLASTFPANISSYNVRRDVKIMNGMDISIEAVSGNMIQAWVTTDQFRQLEEMGYSIIALPDEAKKYVVSPGKSTKDVKDPTRDYYSYEQLITYMLFIANQYPDICQMVQVGRSVQNRAIFMLKISDNVTMEENEPEVELDAAIHGNEVVGYDLLVRLIQLLTSEYSTNPRVANIVNNTEIWINPLFNPDGYVLQQRENANGVDLNRHFPDFITDPNNTVTGREPEIAAHMQFVAAHTLNLGLNYHCGSLVMNYPWDKISALAPDNDLYIDLSEAYSVHNNPMWNSIEFTHGITNGYVWYQVNGSIIDWAYYYHDCLDITCEVSNEYWPNSSALPTYWSQNEESLLSYIEYAQRGIQGIVRNTTDQPLLASLHIDGIEKDIVSDPDVGDYHRILLPGTYNITASATGYRPQTQTGVVVTTGSPAVVNFTLEEAGYVVFKGYVKDIDGNAVSGAVIDLHSDTIPAATSDANGFFQFPNIQENVYTMTVTLNGLIRYNSIFALDTGFRSPFIIVMQPLIFEDHFENGVNSWQLTGSWGLHTTGGNHELTDSPTTEYSDNQNTVAQISQPLDLQSVSEPYISFRVKYDLEAGYDYGYLEASSNGTAWVILATYTGTHDWMNVTYPLSNYSGGACYLRFHLVTDFSVHSYDGIYVDDVVVTGSQGNLLIWGDVNNDGLITKADAQVLLDYTVGMDPLTNIDPRPWEPNRLARADVSNDGSVHATDASLILRYIFGHLYQMPVQSGQGLTYSDPGISLSNEGANINLHAQQFQNLLALNAELIPTNIGMWDITNTVYSDSILISAYVNGNNLNLGYASMPMNSGSVDVFTITPPGNVGPDAPITFNMLVNETPQTIIFSNVANQEQVSVPVITGLKQNYPNPFNPETKIAFTLSKEGRTGLRIYNIRGEEVKTLINGRKQAGSHSIVWDGRDNNGNKVASGVYFCTLDANEKHTTMKMVLLK